MLGGPAHDDPTVLDTEERLRLAHLEEEISSPATGGLLLLHNVGHSLALSAGTHRPLENVESLSDLKGVILDSISNINSSFHADYTPDDPSPYGNMLGSNGLNTALLVSTTSTTYNASYTSPDEIPEFPLYIRVWATIVMSALLLVGVAGNALVPLLVFRNRELRHSTNLFLINLAIADTLLLLICLPTTIIELHSKPETWVMGPFFCKLVHFVEWSVARASVLTLLVISVERYVAICKPLSSTTLCTRPRAALTSAIIWPIATLASMPREALTSALIWPIATLASIPTLLATKFSEADYVDGSRVNVCNTVLEPWAHNYFLISIALFFCIPLLFLLLLYGLIAKRLLDHRTRNRRRLDSPAWKQRKQVVKMLGTVVLVFFVCLFPFRLLLLWILLSPDEFTQNLGMQTYYNLLYICRALSYLNSAINPIIYNAMSSKFRRAFVRLTGLTSFSPRGRLLRRRSTLTTTVNYSSSSEGGGLSRAFSWRRYSDFSFRIQKLNEASSRRASELTLGGKRISFSRKGSKSSFLSKKSSSYSINVPPSPKKKSKEENSTQESQQDQADEEDRMLPCRISNKNLVQENGKSTHNAHGDTYSLEGNGVAEGNMSQDIDKSNKHDLDEEEETKKGKKLADGGKKVSFNDKVEHCDAEKPKDKTENNVPDDIQAFIAADNNRVTHL